MNETVVDVLFYLSKSYRLKIIQQVVDQAKVYYEELRNGGKNTRFKGKVSWIGHSLGTVISYDLLSRQLPLKKPTTARQKE